MFKLRDTYIFDIETNGLRYSQVRPGEKFMDTIHMAGVKNAETGEYRKYCDVIPGCNPLSEFYSLIEQAPVLVGHNIIGFDLPAIEEVTGVKPSGILIDTLLLSKFFYGDIDRIDWANINTSESKGITSPIPKKLAGRHSLKAWGYRLKDNKIEFGNSEDEESVWDKATVEMLDYMEQDVNLTQKLFNMFFPRLQSNWKSLEIEHEFAKWMELQQRFGTYFDTEKALELERTLLADFDKTLEDIQKVFPPRVVNLGLFVPKRDNKTKGYGKGVECTKIEIEKKFKPTPNNIAKRLVEEFGWVPEKYSDKTGKPNLDSEIMETIDIEGIEPVKRYFMLKKRLGMLSEGKNAWLKLVKGNRIHGSIDTLGARSHRCTHSKPNLGQVTGAYKEFGKEMRQLFSCPEGWTYINSDLEQIELRILASCLHEFDDGAYTDICLNHDAHVHNQLAMGIETRNQAKVAAFAIIYGAGDEQAGKSAYPKILDINERRRLGKKIKRNMKNNVKGFKALEKKALDEMKYNKGRVVLLDGRLVPVDSDHKRLNAKIQGSAAVYMKVWTNRSYQELTKALGAPSYNGNWVPVANVHDEISILIKSLSDLDIVKNILKEAINYADKLLNVNCRNDCGIAVGKDWSVH